MAERGAQTFKVGLQNKVVGPKQSLFWVHVCPWEQRGQVVSPPPHPLGESHTAQGVNAVHVEKVGRRVVAHVWEVPLGRDAMG